LTPGFSVSKFVRLDPHSVAKDWHVSPETAAEEKLQDMALPILFFVSVGFEGLGERLEDEVLEEMGD